MQIKINKTGSKKEEQEVVIKKPVEKVVEAVKVKPVKESKKVKESTSEGKDYSAKDIFVLEGLDPVRKRPGMYIGSTGISGLHHLVWEVFDNSIDEALGGFCNKIKIELLENNRVAVLDNGRGIPVDYHAQSKKSALETVLTTLHAGGKFGGDSYKISGGLHGVGVSVVNALSTYLKAEVYRDGFLYTQEYSKGKPTSQVTKVKSKEKIEHGTRITFEPDPTIMQEIRFDWKTILDHIREQAYLVRKIQIDLADRREKKDEKDYTFYFENGIVAFLNYLIRDHETKSIQKNIFYVADTSNEIDVEIALSYVNEIETSELAFANNIHTPEGGMHLTGFRSALTRVLNDYLKKTYAKENLSLTGDDVREGLMVIVSVKIREPQFEGQTKAKLGNPEARVAVDQVMSKAFRDFLEKNPEDVKRIIEKCLISAKARSAAKLARENVLRKSVMEHTTLPGKLADCISRKAENSELFIVEGDSAGGCFSGDTKIKLTDGRNLSFVELIKEDLEGKKNYCYTVMNDGNIGIAEIKNPRKTKENQKVLKIILDNNEEIVCTLDHKFMLRDGEYKEAKNLNIKDSLMPLYTKLSVKEKRITISGYEMVLNPNTHKWLFTHRLSDKYNLINNVYKEIDGCMVHHIDFNKVNNNPDNLIRIDKEEHLKIHRDLCKITLLSEESKNKAREAHLTKEYREKIKNIMLSPDNRKMLSDRAKKQWENNDYKEFMKNKYLEFYNNNLEYRLSNLKCLNEAQLKYWSNKENRQKQSDKVKEYFCNNKNAKKYLADKAKEQWENEELLQWRSAQTKKQWIDSFRAIRKDSYNKTYLNKALGVMHSIFEKQVIDFSEILNMYNKLRKETNDKSLIRPETICQRFFNNSQNEMFEAVKCYNHKVKEIIYLDELIDVYDLEVENTHNFALASGVFVHNSAKQGRDRHTQAILPLRGKILNVEKARLDRMMGSEEIKAIILALGTSISEDFNIDKLRYHKIVLMSDADVDGAHIRTLLLTLFYRYFLPVIEKGCLYAAQPPLYRIQKGKTFRYAYSDEEKERILEEILKLKDEKKEAKGKKEKEEEVEEEENAENSENSDEAVETQKYKGVIVQRYKGLGEMNPEQLWETTMDPKVRILKQITIDDAKEADRLFDILMGEERMPRKKFIQVYAKKVKNLDV